ncbi:hypothetical protein, partial [Candidatus Amarobacter glycogenicus]|uniref:hypothetical protein n=1 Tax=Candidatus Amarobacter glycogenicus TaxID=3140699 RepID=UPI0031CCCF38
MQNLFISLGVIALFLITGIVDGHLASALPSSSARTQHLVVVVNALGAAGGQRKYKRKTVTDW